MEKRNYYRCVPRIDANGVSLDIIEYSVTYDTPKGVWISAIGLSDKYKWSSNTSKRKFAYPTRHEALAGYVKLTKGYIFHLERKLENAKALLNYAKLCRDRNEVEKLSGEAGGGRKSYKMS